MTISLTISLDKYDYYISKLGLISYDYVNTIRWRRFLHWFRKYTSPVVYLICKLNKQRFQIQSIILTQILSESPNLHHLVLMTRQNMKLSA